jgi:hypothetical protein
MAGLREEAGDRNGAERLYWQAIDGGSRHLAERLAHVIDTGDPGKRQSHTLFPR